MLWHGTARQNPPPFWCHCMAYQGPFKPQTRSLAASGGWGVGYKSTAAGNKTAHRHNSCRVVRVAEWHAWAVSWREWHTRHTRLAATNCNFLQQFMR